MERPYVWQMIKEAVENLNGSASYSEIKNYINHKWENVNQFTITAQIIVLSVNHDSRIHYPENHKPRITNSNSQYDILFNTNRGQVEIYNQNIHGLWEIYQDLNNKPKVRQFEQEISKTIYSPTDIIWFKNVTNTINGEAYLSNLENPFIIHFPTKHKTNVLSPSIGELILIYQKVNGIPAFTHIVSPVDNELIDDNTRPNYRFGRRVKIIAKTNVDNFIPVNSTLWQRLNFSGITQGNACKLENIANHGNTEELQYDIWKKFTNYFIPSEQQSSIVISSIIDEIETSNNDISAIEGKLRLVTHLLKERNRKIILEKKQQAILNNNLLCEVCKFSFIEKYNSNFIECHHLNPISQKGVRETKLEDLALVCANCHRMLHAKFDGQYLSIIQLQERIKFNKS